MAPASLLPLRSDVLLATVCEVNEKILPAITLRSKPPVSASSQEGGGCEHKEEEDEEGIQSPDPDTYVLRPLDFDPLTVDDEPGAGLALHQRRRFSRQRGSISLDGKDLPLPSVA